MPRPMMILAKERQAGQHVSPIREQSVAQGSPSTPGQGAHQGFARPIVRVAADLLRLFVLLSDVEKFESRSQNQHLHDNENDDDSCEDRQYNTQGARGTRGEEGNHSADQQPHQVGKPYFCD